MSRGAQKFTQTDVTKVIKAAVNAGLTVGRVEISADGRIIVIAGAPGQGQNFGATEVNEWDAVK